MDDRWLPAESCCIDAAPNQLERPGRTSPKANICPAVTKIPASQYFVNIVLKKPIAMSTAKKQDQISSTDKTPLEKKREEKTGTSMIPHNDNTISCQPRSWGRFAPSKATIGQSEAA